MAGADVGSLKATLEFDLGDAKSVLDDFKGSLDEIVDKLNERLSLDIDASGASSAIDEAKAKADEFKDSADAIKNNEISGDSSGFTSATDSAGSSTDALAGQLEGLKSTIDTAFDVAIVAAFAAAIWEAGDAVMGLAEQFGEMQDASQRAAMFGNTAMADMGARTAQIMEQADKAAVKYGVPSEQVAGMIGTFAQFGTTQLSQDQINAAVGAARGMQLEPSDLARGIQSAYTTTQGAYSQQEILDIMSRAYTTTGLAPTTQISTALTKLQPMAGELGGLPGEMAALMYGTQIMPGGRGVNMIATGLESFDKQLNETYLTVDSKGKAVIKGSEDIYNAFQQAGLSFTQEQARGPLQALNDLYEAGQRMGKDFFPQAFGSQAGIMEALGAGLPKIQEYESILEDSGGATEDLAAKVDDLQMSLDRMDEAFESMGESAGSLTEGPLRNMADFVTGPLLDGFNSIIDKLKSGDIKGALQEAFDLGNIILNAPIEGLEDFRNQILSFDWRDLGHTVADILGDSMSQIYIDAGELGKTIAAGLAAAMDFARGALGGQDIWSALTGKTPLDAFLQPIEKMMSAEFGLIAAEMALKMKEGSVGAIQALYSLHDAGITALAGLLTSVQMLASAFSGMLLDAITAVADRLGLGFQVGPITGLEGGGGTGGGGGTSTAVPSGTQAYEQIATDYEKAHHAEIVASADAWAKTSQELASKNKIDTVSSITGTLAELLKVKGYNVEIAPAQLMGTGYAAQSWEGPVADVVKGAPGEFADLWGEIKQDWDNMDWGAFFSTPAADIITGQPALHGLDEETNTNFIKMNDTTKSAGDKSKENTIAINENTGQLKTWEQYNRENIAMLGGLWGKYEPDLSEYQQAVALATGTLEEAKEGLKNFRSSTDQTSDSMKNASDSANKMGESCKNCTQANETILGLLQGLTGTEALDPGSFRAAVESLGTMFAASYVGPTALYAAEHPELMGKDKTLRLGAINRMDEAEYKAYYTSIIPPDTTVSGIIGTSQAYLPAEGAADDWLGCAAGVGETAQKIDLVTGAIRGAHGEFVEYADCAKEATHQVIEGLKEYHCGISDVNQALKDPTTLTLMTDTLQASQDIASLSDKAESDKKMPIKLGGVDEAKATFDDLTQPEYKYIYVVTLHSSMSVAGGFSALAGAGEYNLSGIYKEFSTPFTPNMSIMDIPSFQHEGYVPRPTLAVVGDRPGGEYVLSAERVEQLGRGGGGIQITYAPTINGSGLSAGELEYILDQQREKLIDDAAQEAAFRQWR